MENKLFLISRVMEVAVGKMHLTVKTFQMNTLRYF
jgi:hypothetical protein